jgi:O-antigen biosynthesis protein WbqP
MLKRYFDILASVALLIILALLILLIGGMVRLTSPGPAIYWAERVG